MKKLTTIALIGVTVGLLGACAQTTAPAKTPSTKTVISSKQYTTSELQARFTRVTDAAVKPLELVSYQQPTAKVQAALTTANKQLAAVRLELVSNQSQPALTKALIHYLDAAKKMLAVMDDGDQAAFDTAAKAFSTQCSTLGRQYFGGQLPASIVAYSKRVSR